MPTTKFKITTIGLGIIAGAGVLGCRGVDLRSSWSKVSDRQVSRAGTVANLPNSSGYFVSPQGSDDNPGTRELPFQTVQKCAEVVVPGSTCWLREGIYRETIQPKMSGTRAKPIAFAAYRDEAVTISGTELVDSWSQYREGIYQAEIELPVDGYSDTGFFANQIFSDRQMMPEARVPNISQERDYLRPEMFGGGLESLGNKQAKIVNEEVPELKEGWTGGRVWTNEWYTTRTGEITGGDASELRANMTAEWERGGFWFYLFGKLELLDDPGEWFYQDNKLYFWSPDGNAPQNVEVKQRNFAFDLSNRSHITLRGLNLFANTITTSDSSQGIIIDGIRAKYVSHHMTLPPLPKSEQAPNSDDGLFLAAHGHDTGIQLRGSNHTLINSVIDGSAGNGVLLEGNNHRLNNNLILNTNYKVSYAAGIRLNGNGHEISHNTIRRTGRDAISWDWHTAGSDGRNLEISYNDLAEFGMLSTDLGGIYVCCYVDLAGGSIDHNWIRDVQSFSPFWGTRGIYLDIESFNSTIHHNVVWNLTGGKDNYTLSGGSPRGKDRIFNNTFLGKVDLGGEYVEARNNIFADNENITFNRASTNLFADAKLKFAHQPKAKFQIKDRVPDFTPQKGSPAIDSGVYIPEITLDFKGRSPDIGAYERDAPPWQAGSNLKYHPERN